MAITRKANAKWTGDLKTGKGTVSSASGVLKETPYDAKSRFEQGTHTNPEELLAAAHAGCFSMALANNLSKAGHTVSSLQTEATFHLDMTSGPNPTKIALVTRGKVAGIDDATFKKFAEETKSTCPVSKALRALEMTVDAKLDA